MPVRPTAFVREGDVPYQSVSIILKAAEKRLIPGTLRYIQLRAATDPTKINVSFNGSSFYNLPAGEQLADFEADQVWVENTDVAPNAVTIVTGMASLNSTRVIIDASTGLSVAVTGTAAMSSVDLGVKADTPATTDTGAFSLIALFKRWLARGQTTAAVVVSAATTNAQSIATGARRLHSLTIYNYSGANKYVRLYDKASAPTVGTDVPSRVFVTAANIGQTISLPVGDAFALGIALAITGATGPLDATATAANDVLVVLNYV